MTSQCPVLELLPILEGWDAPASPQPKQSLADAIVKRQPGAGSGNVVAHQENSRRIVDWSRRMCAHIDERGVDGGSP